MEAGGQNISADMLKRIGKALGKNLITLSPGTVNISVVGGKSYPAPLKPTPPKTVRWHFCVHHF